MKEKFIYLENNVLKEGIYHAEFPRFLAKIIQTKNRREAEKIMKRQHGVTTEVEGNYFAITVHLWIDEPVHQKPILEETGLWWETYFKACFIE